MVNNVFPILYAEDDEEDRFLFLEGVKEAKEAVTIIHAENGDQVLKYLLQIKRPHELPLAIISDLKMPLRDGLEVLQLVKQEPMWRHIPFILFSTSSSHADKKMAMGMGAEAFYSKPNSVQEVMNTVKEIIALCKQVHDKNNSV